MKSKNKIITAVLLAAGTAAGTALINKYIKVSATSKKLLSHPEPSIYKWRLGDIYYAKTGTGKPLLLIHDLTGLLQLLQVGTHSIHDDAGMSFWVFIVPLEQVIY